MTDQTIQDRHGPAVYEVTVFGHLARGMTHWLDGVTLTTHADGKTTLRSRPIDQAALYGLLEKVRDLGLGLVSVQRIARREEE